MRQGGLRPDCSRRSIQCATRLSRARGFHLGGFKVGMGGLKMMECPHGASRTPLLPRGVRCALDAMRANLERDWSVAVLADTAGVSGRTLQRQFQAFLGKAPRTALRDLRFACARRALLQGVRDAKVMDIALRCGFPHFGRFSVEYRRRYGETPSQTLRRQAVFIGALASMPSIFISARDRPTMALR